MAIRPQRKNANRHTQRGMGLLESSIEKDGWIGAITTAADGETFDGSARVEVTARMEMLDDPIVIDSDGTRPIVVRRVDIPNADDPRAKRLGIAANRVGQVNLEWEPDVLAALAEEMDLGGLFRPDELAEYAQPSMPEPGACGDEFDTTPDDGPTRAQLGDLWIIGGKHRLLVGDCTDPANVARLMDGERADMVLTDPPYGMDLDTDYSQMPQETVKGKQYARVTGDDRDFDFSPFAAIECREQFWWGADYYCQQLPKGGSWFVWDKRNEHNDTALGSGFELCWSKTPHKRRLLRYLWSGFTARDPGERREHPTQKPIAMCSELIGDYSSVGSLVYDPFLGSGTTMVAAHNLGRRCFGCEVEPRYADVILKRMESLGLAAVCIEDPSGQNISLDMAEAA